MYRDTRSTARRIGRAMVAIAALGLPPLAAPASAQIRDLPGVRGGPTLQANDDGSSGAVPIGFGPINYFGLIFSSLYVNNNGNVTFDLPLATFTPFGLTTNIGRPIIAPWFADVDTRGPSLAGSPDGGGNAGNVAQAFDGTGLVTYGNDMVGTNQAFGVNWFSDCRNWSGAGAGPACPADNRIGVGYYRGHTTWLNEFQLVMIDRSADFQPGDFDFEFNYECPMEWETGDASGGTNGLGGSSVRIGYSNGTGNPNTFSERPGSGVNGAFISRPPTSSGRCLGRQLHEVRNGTVVLATPEPATIFLTASGLAVVGFAVRRRNR